MKFFEDLLRFSEHVKTIQPSITNEEQTKQWLVLPFLEVLGFNIRSTEVTPEYEADFARRRIAGPPEKIDYAICIDGAPAIFLECKAINVALEKHHGQLARYFNAVQSVKLAIITNGIQYHFFTELHAPNIMDEVPFLEFNINRFTERDAELLLRLTKGQFKADLVERHAEDILLIREFDSLLDKLFNESADIFLRFALNELNIANGKSKSAKAILDRYRPIIKESIELVLHGRSKTAEKEISQPKAELAKPMALMLESARASQDKPVSVPVPSAAQSPRSEAAKPTRSAQPQQPESGPESPVNDRKDGIGSATTEEEEQKCLALVRRICAKSKWQFSIDGKQDARFFTIYFGPRNTWFLRLRIGTDRKSCMTRLAVEEAKKLVSEGALLKVDQPSEQWGVSRVVFESTADLEKLDRLILAAYEDAVNRK